ncbi:pyridoxal-phosphate-dependent aminotransferase family protein [Staphylococcus canis]|uniref:Alanine--glyoxylate aminotransferase family protein n=1 Tax=Staphylococcus canis TaxID=2724942 RepID=A0ABS0T683_9STAP|nr:alanine--glyoxylate aminotransferase family protein [Staphylococcus canis]MBI5974249.1 alanine--glyoxylate aminotransferase family protein [Staphylococcus canis]
MLFTHHLSLLTPGPTPVPRSIQNAMNQPMIGHRSKDFENVAEAAFKALKPVFGSEQDVMILSSSGTSALEASMVNIVNPNDHIVVIVSGAFGKRYQQIAETYYQNVHVLDVEWGTAFKTDEVLSFIENLNVPISAVFTQFCETSTAVLHPVAELGRALKSHYESIYFVVDGVSCIGAVDVDMNRDGIDVLVSGSQKALMLPPGISFVAYNDRALERFNTVKTPSFYLNLAKHRNALAQHSTPFTPNISAFRGVLAFEELVKSEGLSHIIQRHNSIKKAVRQALTALDLELLVKDSDASPTVTAFVPKDKKEVDIIKKRLKEDFNITIAGGQGQLKGSILRVGHMGFISPFELLPFLVGLEIILTDHRKKPYIGVATKIFTEVIYHEL